MAKLNKALVIRFVIAGAGGGVVSAVVCSAADIDSGVLKGLIMGGIIGAIVVLMCWRSSDKPKDEGKE